MLNSSEMDRNLDQPAFHLPLYINMTTTSSNHTRKNKSCLQSGNLKFTLSVDYCYRELSWDRKDGRR